MAEYSKYTHEEPIVRPPTKGEQGHTAFEAGNRTSRVVQIIQQVQIDRERFREAARAHPEKRAHLLRVAHAQETFATRMVDFMETEYKAQPPAVVVPYSGTEGIFDIPHPVTVPTGRRANLPA